MYRFAEFVSLKMKIRQKTSEEKNQKKTFEEKIADLQCLMTSLSQFRKRKEWQCLMASLSQLEILTLSLFLRTAWGAKPFFPKRYAMPNDVTVAVENLGMF